MIEVIKSGLFSIPGIAVTVIHNLIILGFLSSLILISAMTQSVKKSDVKPWPLSELGLDK